MPSACHEIETNDRKLPFLGFPQDYTYHYYFGADVNLTISNILVVCKSSRGFNFVIAQNFSFHVDLISQLRDLGKI